MSIFGKKVEKKSESRNDPARREDHSGGEVDIDVGEVDRTSPGAVASTAYGIADAMRLMRSLPVDQNIDLVVRVVRVTLGSVNVRIEDIIEDATRRQQAIQDNIAALHEKVADLEEELEARRREIAAQEADFKETSSVKERLLLAEKSAHLATGAHRVTNQNHTAAQDQPQSGTQPPQPPPLPSTRPLPKPSPRE